MPKEVNESLTLEQKRQLREHHERHPYKTHTSLGLWAQKHFNLAKPPSTHGITKRQIFLTTEQKCQIRAHKTRHPSATYHSLASWAQKQFKLAREPRKASINRILNRFQLDEGPSKQTVSRILMLAGYGTGKQPLMYLSDEQKRQICKHKARHPTITQSAIVSWALKQFHLANPPCTTYVNDILKAAGYCMPKQPLIYLTDEQKHQIRKYKARHPDMTRPSLALWAKGQFNLAKTPCKTTICRILNLEIRDRAYEASDYGFQDDCISISSDDNGQGGEHEFGKENDEDEEGEEQEVKIDVEQDTDVTFEAEKTCRSDNWSLKQKLRALFVVIPLLDPFTQKQQEAYGVLYELYIRLKIPGQEQELIEANKRNSLSLVMRLLDRSVESHRSTYVVPSQELDKLSDDD